jgi:hypothetical protein
MTYPDVVVVRAQTMASDVAQGARSRLEACMGLLHFPDKLMIGAMQRHSAYLYALARESYAHIYH